MRCLVSARHVQRLLLRRMQVVGIAGQSSVGDVQQSTEGTAVTRRRAGRFLALQRQSFSPLCRLLADMNWEHSDGLSIQLIAVDIRLQYARTLNRAGSREFFRGRCAI